MDIPDVELAWLEGVTEEMVRILSADSRQESLRRFALIALRLAYRRGKRLGAEGQMIPPMPERTAIPPLD